MVVTQYFCNIAVLCIFVWAIEWSAQRRLARQKEEELRLATMYSNSGDMGLQITLVSCLRGTDSLGSTIVNFQQ